MRQIHWQFYLPLDKGPQDKLYSEIISIEHFVY